MRYLWTLLACLTLLTSCGKEIPDDIIQPEQMERVLYDYHLSMGMSSNSSKNTEKVAHKQYIFEKHGITEAEFDSSMVWYTRESKELMTIYENLNRRFSREYDHIERLLESREDASARTSVSGDTVDIWRKADMYWMTKTPLNNQLAFDIKGDTTFHERDAFLWNMDYIFFSPGEVIMGMNVVYENDSVVGTTQVIKESGPQSIYLYTDSTYKVKMLNGFIYVANDSVLKPNILVHNLSLTRFHRPEVKDSLVTDTVSAKKEIVKEEKKIEKKELQKPQDLKKETSTPQSIRDKKRPRGMRMEKMNTQE